MQEQKEGNLKAKIDELESNNKTKINTNLYRDISDFKKIYKPRGNIVKDEKGGLVTDSHSTLLGGVNISLNYGMYMALTTLYGNTYNRITSV